MTDTRRFAQPVRRALLEREMLAGIPQAGLLLLVFLAVIFMYGLQLYFTIVPIIALYVIMRQLTKKDPWFIDIVLDNIMQRDKLIP